MARMNERGATYACAACGGAFLVFQAGEGVLACSGAPMNRRSTDFTNTSDPREARDPVGTRFRCATCGTAALCTVAPEQDVLCCSVAMERQQIATLPPVG
jgi:hypothetical protein